MNRPLTLLLSLAALALPAYAEEKATLTLINHFDKTIKYTVSINQEVLPDFPVTFTLAAGSNTKSRILDIHKQAYIQGQDETNVTGQENNVFFAIELVNGAPLLHGYISKGIAYTMASGRVIFCSPSAFQARGQCT